MRKRIQQRNKLLTANNQNLEQAVKALTAKIYIAKNNKSKLEVLIKYKFLLPMSSAILAVLYPKDFTVYDVRVCETFLKFKLKLNDC